MNDLEALSSEYGALLMQQQFKESDLDYRIFDAHQPFLEQLASINNSGITVFDMHRKTHIFTSYNFSELFGYEMDTLNQEGTAYFDSKVHPEDFIELLKNGIATLKHYYRLAQPDRMNYKLVNEYRILGAEQKYIRVIEQHQVLELDKYGNVWLALGVLDISPDQSPLTGIKSKLFNYKTGKVLSLEATEQVAPNLSKREKQVLQYVKDGFLSKEISEQLSISVHTVNTHRQRILEKLGANNSHEAIAFAGKYSLIR